MTEITAEAALNHLAGMLEGAQTNVAEVAQIKKNHPDLPEIVNLYLDVSAETMLTLVQLILTANETIMTLGDMLDNANPHQ